MKKQKILLEDCLHCGNKGLMSVLCEHTNNDIDYFYNSDGTLSDDGIGENYNWSLLACPVCNRLTLFEEYKSDIERESSFAILYPKNRIPFLGVPPKIQSAFKSTLKIKNIDTAICVLSLRRTLEAICKDKGAKGSTLEIMIKDLIKKNILPTGFDDACFIIRKLGNDAAHAEDTIFYFHEVEEMINFLETIINYLYVLPKQIEKLKMGLNNKK